MQLTVTKKPFRRQPVGSVIDVPDSQGKLLVRLGRGTYATTAFQNSPHQAVMTAAHTPVAAPGEVTEQAHPYDPVPAPAPASVDLDALEKDELHALAKRLNVAVHHASGADKVRAAIRESQVAAE